MGIKKRFKIKKQQRWNRRKSRQKLAALASKNPQSDSQKPSGTVPVNPTQEQQK